MDITSGKGAGLDAPARDSDQITVLTTRGGLALAKRWLSNGGLQGYGKTKNYSRHVRLTAGIRALSQLLSELESDPHSCIIRGKYRGDAEALPAMQEDEGWQRGCVLRNERVFCDQALHAVMIDVDGYGPASDPIREPERAVCEFIRESLPACFTERSFHWQLSASAGRPDAAGKLKAHVWFWLETPATSAQLKAWAPKQCEGVDASLFQPTQPHYTAAPQFDPGIDDPVPKRSGFYDGLMGDSVPLEIGQADVADLADLPRGDAPLPDPVIQALTERGMLHKQLKSSTAKGAYAIKCPRSEHHTSESGETSTIYYPAHTGGHARGTFVCKHAHCAGVAQGEFLQALGIDEGAQPSPQLADFMAYLPNHSYLHKPTRIHWPAASVNNVCKWPKGPGEKSLQPSVWLDQNSPIHQLTWLPDAPEVLKNQSVQGGGIMPTEGVNVFNLYLPPIRLAGDSRQAGRWLDHLKRIYPDDWFHLTHWLAHRVQRPGEKLNHALVLGGPQGIGKDTILEPVKCAVGHWNWGEISPNALSERFNTWARNVIVRVSEARDHGGMNRHQLYEASKTYIAAPPDVISVDEKNVPVHPIINVVGLIITTNHRTDGIYLPADDRRHYVAWSQATKGEFSDAYWHDIWSWYEAGGFGHVAQYLREVDLSAFNPKSPPTKTAAFWNIVMAGEPPENGELRDAIARLPNPEAFIVDDILEMLTGSQLAFELSGPKGRNTLPQKLERVDYVCVRNPDAEDGLWRVDGRRKTIYATTALPLDEQIRAARARKGRPTVQFEFDDKR